MSRFNFFCQRPLKILLSTTLKHQNMIKRLLLPTVTGMMFTTAVMAQCDFDQQFSGLGPGMFPDQLEPVVTCEGCGSHTRSVSLVTNTFINVANPLQPGSTITLYIDATKLLSIEGHPEGTSYGTDLGPAPDELGIWLNAGTVPNQTAAEGCSYVTGEEAAWQAAIGGGPNNDGVYPLTITVDARIHSSSPDISGFVPNGTWASDVDASLGGGAIVFDTYEIVVQEDATVSIRERETAFAAYPNPATDVLRFNLGSNEGAQVEVFDLTGSRVLEARLSSGVNALDVNVLRAGLYTYVLTGADGSRMHVGRTVIAR